MDKFKQFLVKVPKHDCDIVLQFACGEEINIQCRPSNADECYEGSLDIILPVDQTVTCWEGDDMQPSQQVGDQPETRKAKQLVLEMPKIGKQTWGGCGSIGSF